MDQNTIDEEGGLFFILLFWLFVDVFNIFTVVLATVVWMPDRKATAMLDCEDGETEANSNCKHCQGRKNYINFSVNGYCVVISAC